MIIIIIIIVHVHFFYLKKINQSINFWLCSKVIESESWKMHFFFIFNKIPNEIDYKDKTE